MFELWTHDAITGDERRQVFPAEQGAQWSMNLAGTGTCSFVFVVNDAETGMSGVEIGSVFAPNSTLLALRVGLAVVGAWKIEDWDYDDDKGTVTVAGVELVRNESKWRMTYGLSQYDQGTLVVTNRSYQGAVRAIVSRLINRSPEWNYPIDLPADGSGSFSQTWEYWKKYTMEDLFVQIEQQGVEIYFRPYLTGGRQLRFQTIVATRVMVGTSYFHLQSADRPLSGIRYKVDGSGQLTGAQGLGEGTGQDQEVRYTPNEPPYPIPIRDAKQTFPDLTGARLQAATDAWLEVDELPIVQWTVGSFVVSDDYPVEHALVARGWTLESKGHTVFPDGTHQLRVIASSGSWSNQITTEVQRGS